MITDTGFFETTNPVQTAKARTPIHRLNLPGALPDVFLFFCVGEKKIVSTQLYICPLNRHLKWWRMEAYTEQQVKIPILGTYPVILFLYHRDRAFHFVVYRPDRGGVL